MSRCILKPHIYFHLQSQLLTGSTLSKTGFNATARLSTFNRPVLGQTVLFYQDGSSIQELPAIVRYIHDKELDIVYFSGIKDINGNMGNNITEEDDYESKEMVAGFERCYTARGVFKLLELIPDKEVTPEVALQALKSIFRLENNQEFRSILGPTDNEGKAENFTRSAVLKNLVAVICQSNNAQVVLEGLAALNKDVTSGNFVSFRDQLCEEVLVRAAESKFTVSQICDAVRAFALLDRKDCADKLWLGLVENQKTIDKNNVVDIVNILPFLKKSRRLVMNLVEKKIVDLWCELNASEVSEIMTVLQKLGTLSSRMSQAFSGWISTNIHRVSETDLLPIIGTFSLMPQSEQGVEVALEKYVKAKGLRISNPAIFCSIMNYCKRFRVRSPLILNGCSEYLMHRKQDITPSQLATMFSTLGLLDFRPSGGSTFWEIFEAELQKCFVQLHPGDALDIMLACVYLEKYPLNFMKKVFNPYFLDRLHSVQQPLLLTALRSKLKALDTAMTLECPLYQGPLLPRDHTAKALWQDGRIKRAGMALVSALQGFVDGYVSSSVVLGQLPLSEMYVVDVFMHPHSLVSPHVPFVEPNTSKAILLHVPEHYDSSGQHLTGIQVVRRRHMQKIGLTVIDLDVNVVQRLRVHPEELREYFIQQQNKALTPLRS